MSLEIGKRFDRHLLLRVLGANAGHGGAARTFLALDPSTTEEIVLQVGEGDQRQLQTFVQNFRKARAQSSPHLPAILAGGLHEGRAYLCTQRIRGVDLYSLIREGALPPEVAARLFWVLTLALSSLHGSGLAHGDLHPRNVRVTLDGQVFLVGFMPQPFGQPSSRLAPEEKIRRYSAPEVLEGAAPGIASDLYSLGLIALELFSGRCLLPKNTVEKARKAQATLAKALDQVLARASGMPHAVRGVVRELLQIAPEARPRDASEVIDGLLRAIPGLLDLRELPGLLKKPLVKAAQRVQYRNLMAARSLLEKSRVLAPAALLLEAAELSGTAGPRLGERLLRQLRRAFWLGFTEACPSREVRQTLYFLLHRTAEALEEPNLSALALVRLGVFTDEKSPFRVFIPPLALLDSRQSQRESYIAALQQNPGDEQALLGLAVRSPDFEADLSGGLSKIKADLLCHHGLYLLALYHRSRDLSLNKNPLSVVEEIEQLAARARRELAGSPPEEVEAPSPPLDVEELTTLPPGRPEDPERPFEPVVDPLGLADASLLELHLSNSRVGEEETPSDPCAGEEDSGVQQARDVPDEADPEVLFSRGQILVYDGRLEEAAETFAQLMESGQLGEERYYSAICSELRKLLWKALVPGEGQEPAFRGIRKICALARKLDLQSLLPLCERLLLRSLPEDGRSDLFEELIREAPTSLTLLQAASTHALELGDRATWARHLLTAAWLLLEVSDITAASKLLMAASSTTDSERIENCRKAIFHRGDELAEVGLGFRELMARFDREADAERALEACEEFLEVHPYFQPAQEEAMELASRLERPERVISGVLELGKRALLREEHATARRFFHFILENEYENDEVLLYLASLNPSVHSLQGEVPEIRLELLRREGLYPAAMHHARKQLQGGQEDVVYLEKLVRLCEESGVDPTPHSLRLGLLALDRRDHGTARRHLERALDTTRELDGTVAVLMETENIWSVFTPMELARRPVQSDPSARPDLRF